MSPLEDVGVSADVSTEYDFFIGVIAGVALSVAAVYLAWPWIAS